jgi:transcriptional repressor NrdR
LLFKASSRHRRLWAVAGRGTAGWSTLIAIVRCPYCDTTEDTRVIDSRPAEEGRAIRRRRQCAVCGQRFTTFERASVVVTVVKRDQSSQPYDSEKVRRGLEAALADRPGAEDAVESVVADIDAWARSGSAVVSSEEIGRQILDALRDLDEVAYLRFASVYKGFQGASDFEREVAALDRES